MVPQVAAEMAVAGCMGDTVAEMVEVHEGYEDMVPAGHRMVAVTVIVRGHQRANRLRVNTRLDAATVECEEDMLGVENRPG